MLSKIFNLFQRKQPLNPLSLIAHDEADLDLFRSLLQDAVLLNGQVYYNQKERYIGLGLSRFCHEKESQQALRVSCLLQIHNVLEVKSKQFDTHAALSLLDIDYQAQETPGYSLKLVFAGESQAIIALKLDCLELYLKDTHAAHRAQSRPLHE